jgi:hypothetical protein
LSSARHSTDVLHAAEGPRCIVGHHVEHGAFIGESEAHPSPKLVVASCREDCAPKLPCWNCCQRAADIKEREERFWQGGECGGVTGRRVGGELFEWGKCGLRTRWPFAGHHRQRERR